MSETLRDLARITREYTKARKEASLNTALAEVKAIKQDKLAGKVKDEENTVIEKQAQAAIAKVYAAIDLEMERREINAQRRK